MLHSDNDNTPNESMIISQVANSHVPQDFTVSRLLSTSNHHLGNNYIFLIICTIYNK